MTCIEIWNRYMKCYDYLMSVGSYVRNLEDIAAACAPYQGQRILDAGSGTGNLSILLNGKGARAWSFDFSPEAVAMHKRKDPTAKIHLGSLEDPLPFPAGSFETVCCASVLFSLSKEGCCNALREFRRVLVPGGRLVVTVAGPTKRNSVLLYRHLANSLRTLGLVQGASHIVKTTPDLIRVLYYNRKLQALPDWKGYHRFTPDELGRFLREAGFCDADLRSTYGSSFILAVAHTPAACPAEAAPVLQMAAAD